MDFKDFKEDTKGLVYFYLNGKFRKMYGIVAADYYVSTDTLILYTVEGHRLIYKRAESIKVSEDIIFNTHWRE